MRWLLVAAMAAVPLFTACEPATKAAPVGLASVVPAASGARTTTAPVPPPPAPASTAAPVAATTAAPAPAAPTTATATRPVTTAPAGAPTTRAATTTRPTTAAVVTTTAAAPAAKVYPNCAALNVDYPHGVGRTGAVDQTKSGKPVTNFTRNDAVYNANTARDGDGDGVACEK